MKTETFKCRYCRQEKPIDELDYDAGLAIAQLQCFEALGHTASYSNWLSGVVAYEVCKSCASEILGDMNNEETDY